MGTVPVKPWNMTRVCAPIFRFDIVSSYDLRPAVVEKEKEICFPADALGGPRNTRPRIMVERVSATDTLKITAIE
jgi:hypothetical protein